MKAVVIHSFLDTLDQIEVSTIDKPRANGNELVVKVVACGLNFVDTLYARGKHQNNKALVRPPFTLGLEFAGIVDSAPSNSPFQIGDKVFGDHTGSFAEYIKLPVDSLSLHRIPASWSFTDCAGLAATLPVSYDSLARRAALKAGETVLVHAAAGGLGIMAVQVAVALGCRVIGTAGTPEKCVYAEKFGADVCINYNTSDWHGRVLELTDGRGVDVVYDPVGLVDLSLKCTAHRGRILIIGFAGREGNMEKVAMNRVLLKQVNLIGYRYGETLRRNPEERQQVWSEINSLIEQNKIRSTVVHLYKGLESVPQALQHLAGRKISGKAVVQVQHYSDQQWPKL